MKFSGKLLYVLTILNIILCQEFFSQEKRDPQKWPFAESSIWNTPVGMGARYVRAGIRETEALGMTIDEDLIVMQPASMHSAT